MTIQVMIVDDDPVILSTLREVLSHLHRSANVVTATSGTAAKTVLEGRVFDVVISDERMPGLRGIELLEWLRTSYPKTVRVLMTAYRDAQMKQEAAERAAADFVLYKPFQLAELRPVLAQATAASRAGAGSWPFGRKGVRVP